MWGNIHMHFYFTIFILHHYGFSRELFARKLHKKDSKSSLSWQQARIQHNSSISFGMWMIHLFYHKGCESGI